MTKTLIALALLMPIAALGQTPAAQLNTLQGNAASVINTNHHTFSSNGWDYWTAAPSYGNHPFIDATEMMMDGNWQLFTPLQIRHTYLAFLAHPNGSGAYPIDLNSDGSADLYYSGCQGGSPLYYTADPLWFIPRLMLKYYQLTSDTTDITTYIALLKAQFLDIPRNGSNHLVDAGGTSTSWISVGYEDGIKKTGDDLAGSVMYASSAYIMAQLYTAIGDSTNAATFTTDGNSIKTSLQGGALWDSTDGMFYAASGLDNQIDIPYSAAASYFGIASTVQIAAIGAYLNTNYASITNSGKGYIRASPTNWASSWGGNQCGLGTGNYLDGYLSAWHQWVGYALAQASVTKARQLITDYLTYSDGTVQWIGQTGTQGAVNCPDAVSGPAAFAVTNTFLGTGQGVAPKIQITAGASLQ